MLHLSDNWLLTLLFKDCWQFSNHPELLLSDKTVGSHNLHEVPNWQCHPGSVQADSQPWSFGLVWELARYRHLLLLSLKADTHFTIPRRVEGLSQSRHCSKSVQPMPKAVFCSFCESMQLPTVGFEPWSSHTAVRHVTTRPLQPARVCLSSSSSSTSNLRQRGS